jgi:endonuclease/exonuclease/phosphatase family metal-dependent hydrolase
MSTKIRVATFNVENLFNRARVLNLRNNAQGDEVLVKIRELESELAKATYDKPRIFSLYKELTKFIEVIEVREKLFKRAGTAIIGVKANGVGEWQGWIEFKRDDFNDEAPENTARVIRAVNADILCMVEVEDRLVLSRFAAQKLKKSAGFRSYTYNILIDGNDPRGIDVALLSRFPIRRLRSHIHDLSPRSDPADGRAPLRAQDRHVFSRDCLEVEVEVSSGVVLHLLLNHFKSKGYGVAAANDARRQLQADTVASFLKEYDLKRDMVVVCGDFNDTPSRPPLQTLLSTPRVHDVLALKFADAAERWSYYYKKREQIDYLLVSEKLKSRWKDSGLERRGIFDLKRISQGALNSFPQVTHPTNSASDHAAVWADFEW